MRLPSSSDSRQTVASLLLPTSRVPGADAAAGSSRASANRKRRCMATSAAAAAGRPAPWRRATVSMFTRDAHCVQRAAWRAPARMASLRGRGIPGVRMQPAGVAVGVALVLPDRHPRLHLVDDPAAGLERRGAMRGAGTGPDREFADGQVADTMHAAGPEDIEA